MLSFFSLMEYVVMNCKFSRKPITMQILSLLINHNCYNTDVKFLSNPKKLRHKQMEIFQYTPANLSDFIKCSFLLQYVTFLHIDRYMHCIMQKKNAQVSIYSNRSKHRLLC